ncbi:acetyltransferase [Arthrobacter sp. Hiyo4]|nr:acetyltransferase [Arthrobacter sp. Hiyo4]
MLDDEIVGHVISTRGWVGDYGLLGLGPIGVTPRLQRHGIGTALMNDTIARANAAGEGGIALLGSTEYYPRFGFVPAASFGVLPPDTAWGTTSSYSRWRSGLAGSTVRFGTPDRLRANEGIPLIGRPSSPIGRGSGLKIRVLWVRVPPGVQILSREFVLTRPSAPPAWPQNGASPTFIPNMQRLL